MADPTRPLPNLVPQPDGSWTGRTVLTPTSLKTRGLPRPLLCRAAWGAKAGEGVGMDGGRLSSASCSLKKVSSCACCCCRSDTRCSLCWQART